MTNHGDHQATLQLLINLEESQQFQKLLDSAFPACRELETQGDIESLRVAAQIRFMIMKALVMTDRHEDAVNVFNETRSKHDSTSDKEILFWVFDASISMADLHWEAGRREMAEAMLHECASRFRNDSHPALRSLSLQATTDLSICCFESGEPDRALSLLNEALVAHVSDTELNVQEEFCRAANQRYHFLHQR